MYSTFFGLELEKSDSSGTRRSFGKGFRGQVSDIKLIQVFYKSCAPIVLHCITSSTCVFTRFNSKIWRVENFPDFLKGSQKIRLPTTPPLLWVLIFDITCHVKHLEICKGISRLYNNSHQTETEETFLELSGWFISSSSFFDENYFTTCQKS
jgi:hypothetical protein